MKYAMRLIYMFSITDKTGVSDPQPIEVKDCPKYYRREEPFPNTNKRELRKTEIGEVKTAYKKNISYYRYVYLEESDKDKAGKIFDEYMEASQRETLKQAFEQIFEKDMPEVINAIIDLSKNGGIASLCSQQEELN